MDCDLCGRQDELVNAVVEGSPLKVCRHCARYGHVVALEKPPEVIKKKKKQINIDLPIEMIVKDYGIKIKEARENLKLTQEELASNIAEKVSVIHKLETYYIEPSLDLAKKLEKYLKISIIFEREKSIKHKHIDFKNNGVTIRDILKMKK